MSAAVFKFVDSVTHAERTGQREIVIRLNDAQALHAEITKLLSTIDRMSNDTKADDITQIELTGGGF